MDGRGPLMPGEEPPGDKARTEWTLVIGGFAIILILGGGLMWLIFGQQFATVGLAVMVGVVILFAFLYLVLKALGDWAKSE
jgi:hypothetical protein